MDEQNVQQAPNQQAKAVDYESLYKKAEAENRKLSERMTKHEQEFSNYKKDVVIKDVARNYNPHCTDTLMAFIDRDNEDYATQITTLREKKPFLFKLEEVKEDKSNFEKIKEIGVALKPAVPQAKDERAEKLDAFIKKGSKKWQ